VGADRLDELDEARALRVVGRDRLEARLDLRALLHVLDDPQPAVQRGVLAAVLLRERGEARRVALGRRIVALEERVAFGIGLHRGVLLVEEAARLVELPLQRGEPPRCGLRHRYRRWCRVRAGIGVAGGRSWIQASAS